MPEKDADIGAPSGPSDASARRLTPAMRRTIIVLAAVVIAGLVVSLSFLFSGNRDSATPAPATSAPATPGPLPGATPADGSEVQSPVPDQTDSARLPPLPQPTPRVTAPLPESASANGSLVDGFPAELMGPAPGAEVISSAIATEGDRMQVTLVARTDASEDSILQHYRDSWFAQGLREGAPAEGAADLSATDAFSSLTLSFTSDSGTGTVYAIHAVLRAS